MKLVLGLFLACNLFLLSSCAHVRETAMSCKDPVASAVAQNIQPFVLAILLCEQTEGETPDCIKRELKRLSLMTTQEAVNCALAKAHDKIIKTELELNGHE